MTEQTGGDSTRLTPLTAKQEEQIGKIREDFKKKMERLGLGMTIKCGDLTWEVTQPPTTGERT